MSGMTHVFLVSSGGSMDGDYQIHGIFSTSEKAQEVMSQLDAKGLTAFVQEYKIDQFWE